MRRERFRGPTRVLAALAAGLTVLLVVGLGELTSNEALAQWDAQVVERLASHREPTVVSWMRILSFAGGWVAIPIGVLIAVVLYWRGRRRSAACYLVTVLSGWALNAILKAAFHRPRPHVVPALAGAGAGWYSYPSGHAMLAPLVFGFGALLLSRGARPSRAAVTILAGLALSVGIAFSRVYLGVHYPTDVIGALVAGCAWAALGMAVYSPLESVGP